ncbi:Nicotinate-nucleotide pyrophosphorylase [carboxylating] [Gracilariopsis chorda]|uniref:Nicotinate-nucleotide pyrophosphorylase [carboxylating] n=1 Tax=Gracilariopsis chorda TaxID=448386 RepID=A0A2V3II87_9FLOR|nr:Nicotinate-nucleotide pyrophosphorylase [carboxylating] [Gracilariopsis chorda]|eukprot:PXF41782.1 Nicotinate-nucleotide pyrophosphorylase [carboxylating] [Gracilariopsis chorda]
MTAAQTIPTTTLSALARSWLQEDCPSFDPAAASLPATPVSAVLYAKSRLLLAGVPFFDAVFREVGCNVVWMQPEPSLIQPLQGKQPLARVTGPPAQLLRGERIALNALSEVCAIATAAHDAVQAVGKLAWTGRLAMTRKTPPGLRLLHKYGAMLGGMDPHRYDLSTPMLKDNHLSAAGNLTSAVSAVRACAGFSAKVEVETSSLSEALSACEAGADIVMLDNFEAASISETVRIVKRQFPNVLVEVSGGVTPTSLESYLIDGVDVVSFSIGKHAASVDLSLKVDTQQSAANAR